MGSSQASGLPMVLPIVIYNGHTRWRAAKDLSSLLYEMPLELDQFRSTTRYVLIDQGAYDSRELADGNNLVAMLFRLERAATADEIDDLVGALIEQLSEVADESLRRAFAVWLERVIPIRFPFYKAISTLRLWEKPGMLAETVQRWAWESRQEGLSQMVSRQLRKRFGSLPDDVQAQVRGADPEQLQVWGEELLDARTLRELFPEKHNVRS